MARTKRDLRPLTPILVIPEGAPRTEEDLTPEQRETAYRALGTVFATLAAIRARKDAEAQERAS